MEKLDRLRAPPGEALEMKQAGDVGRSQDLSAAPGMILQSVESHSDRDRFLLDRKEASESATLVSPGEVDALDSRNPPE